MKSVWINLPVKDLERSAAFFAGIGFSPNPGPGNSTRSASFTIGDDQVVLILFVENVFTGFTDNALCDTAKGTEVLFSLGAESREQVDKLAEKVRKAGGELYCEPVESQGLMYGFGFCDPDGHRWNVLFMET